ncbi:hypothetical protein NDU88_004355 [Pleurodeles waltl]|uniref:Uncharacterized protein n=1 Tax=Pleurodeles waltl TaxID=8319 RepID=A0AAV7PFE8_PLEWA|nr:hypothetical protein NDU88_004355 [Pleurodeles waltl]
MGTFDPTVEAGTSGGIMIPFPPGIPWRVTPPGMRSPSQKGLTGKEPRYTHSPLGLQKRFSAGREIIADQQ